MAQNSSRTVGRHLLHAEVHEFIAVGIEFACRYARSQGEHGCCTDSDKPVAR